jgi:hypothetical protein
MRMKRMMKSMMMKTTTTIVKTEMNITNIIIHITTIIMVSPRSTSKLEENYSTLEHTSWQKVVNMGNFS